MKLIVWLAAMLIALSGCAVVPTGADAESSEFDTAKMNAVEQAATRGGVRVYWINAPRRISRASTG
jgi:uncharacterized protein YceK